MQNIIIDQPYRSVPPKAGSFWPRLLRFVLPTYLSKSHGIESHDLLGVERLKASVEAGHGIMLTPNHCRPCDPMVLFSLGAAVGRPVCTMASWHLFHDGWLTAWLMRRLGGFSLHREGVDRQAINMAIEVLTEGKRPLIIFLGRPTTM